MKKKQHLEDTEARNHDLLAENSQLRDKNRELEEKVRQLETQLRQNQVARNSAQKRMIVPALFSIVGIVGILAYPPGQLSGPSGISISRATDLSFPSASPIGRKLMAVNEMESDLNDFWLDDVLHDLRKNKGFTSILKLVQNGPIDLRRMVQRKLYEEFKISFRELRKSYPLKYQRRNNGLPIGIEGEKHRMRPSSPSVPAPKLQNQMCEPKVNGKEIHRMFKNWKNAHDGHPTEPDPPTDTHWANVGNNTDARNETGLIHGSRTVSWTQADLLRSLGPSLKNNSYYLVSSAPLPIIAPLKQDNTSNPRITFGSFFLFLATC